MPEYYFLREKNYCSCCTVHYKTVVIEAKCLDDVKYAILHDECIRKEFIQILCEKNKKNVYMMSPTQENVTEEEFEKYITEYYKSHDIIEDMNSTYYKVERMGIRYMGEGDAAYLEYTKNDDPTHSKYCIAENV